MWRCLAWICLLSPILQIVLCGVGLGTNWSNCIGFNIHYYCSFSFAIPMLLSSCGWMGNHSSDCNPFMYVFTAVLQSIQFSIYLTLTCLQTSTCYKQIASAEGWVWPTLGVFELGNMCLAWCAVSRFVKFGWRDDAQRPLVE